MTNTPSTEERVWAVLSHLSAVAFGMGLLLPVIGWSEQRRKSKYASFHCLQALGYQSLGYTIWFLSYLVLVIVIIVGMAVVISIADGMGGRGSPFIGTGMGIFISIISLGGFFLYLLFPVIAAISCAMGRDYRYPIMGDRLAHYLGYNKSGDDADFLIADHEDRWVTAMGHISVIIPLWGFLPSLTAWILQGKRSLFLKFQSIQTIAYQVFVNGLNMISGVVYMAGFIIFIALTGFEVGQAPSSGGMVGLAALLVSMACAMLIVLLIPLFHILGQWAGYRVLKGDNYHYPLIGRLAERWAQKSIAQASPDVSEPVRG